jgi:hypothetical protein
LLALSDLLLASAGQLLIYCLLFKSIYFKLFLLSLVCHRSPLFVISNHQLFSEQLMIADNNEQLMIADNSAGETRTCVQ